MAQNQQTTLNTLAIDIREVLAGVLSFGVVVASLHGALLPGHYQSVSPTDFKAKVTGELHAHSDLQVQTNHLLIDPKYLRSVRSEGDKESDSRRDNWDIYLV